MSDPQQALALFSLSPEPHNPGTAQLLRLHLWLRPGSHLLQKEEAKTLKPEHVSEPPGESCQNTDCVPSLWYLIWSLGASENLHS